MYVPLYIDDYVLTFNINVELLRLIYVPLYINEYVLT